MKGLLGLDLATRTGWCLDGQTGVWDLSGDRGEPDGLRFTRLWGALTRFLDEHPGVVGIVAEEPYGGGRRTAMVLGGLIAVMEVVCHHRDLEYAFVNSSALKSFARAQGVEPLKDVRKGLKEAMRRAAADALDDPDISTDEADAWWVLRWYEEIHAARS